MVINTIFPDLIFIITYSPNLISLHIRAVWFDNAFAGSANGSLKLPFLRELTLEGFQPGAKFVLELLNALDAPALSSLNLLVGEPEWGEVQGELAAPKVSTLPKLTFLSIIGQEHLPEIDGMTALFEFIPALHSLKLVRLSGRWVKIGAALRDGAPKLRRVEIEDCDITLNDLASLFRIRTSHTSQPGDRETLELIAVRRCLAIHPAVAVAMKKRTRHFEWEFEWKDPETDSNIVDAPRS